MLYLLPHVADFFIKVLLLLLKPVDGLLDIVVILPVHLIEQVEEWPARLEPVIGLEWRDGIFLTCLRNILVNKLCVTRLWAYLACDVKGADSLLTKEDVGHSWLCTDQMTQVDLG